MPSAKGLGNNFFPGMGAQYEIGLINVGLCAVDVTLGFCTAPAVATVLASPPNTGAQTGYSCGPVVHSLGAAPSVYFAVKVGSNTADYNVDFQVITADNSAVYLRTLNGTAGVGYVGARVIAIR